MSWYPMWYDAEGLALKRNIISRVGQELGSREAFEPLMEEAVDLIERYGYTDPANDKDDVALQLGISHDLARAIIKYVSE